MFTLLLILHIFVCLLIIFFVLLQSGKGAELGAAFGGIGQAHSSRGAMSGIGKATTVVAVLFMVTSLSLAFLSSEQAKESVVRELEAVPTVPGARPLPAPTETSPQTNQPITLPEPETQTDLPQTEAPPLQLEQTEAPPLNASPAEVNPESSQQ